MKNNKNYKSKLLTASELAVVLGVCLRTIRKWTSSRKISSLKMGRKCVRYRVEKVIEDLERNHGVAAISRKQRK